MGILILAPECTYEAIDVQDLRRTLVFVVPPAVPAASS